jgi:hypothetical protein
LVVIVLCFFGFRLSPLCVPPFPSEAPDRVGFPFCYLFATVPPTLPLICPRRGRAPSLSGVSKASAVANEWVIDGETTLDATLSKEFVYGGAYGFEQFYGFAFELTGEAAAALQQSLQPTNKPVNSNSGVNRDGDAEGSAGSEYYTEVSSAGAGAGAGDDSVEGGAGSPAAAAEATDGGGGARRRLTNLQDRKHQRTLGAKQAREQALKGKRRILSDEEARQRNLPKGAQLITHVRRPLPKVGVSGSCNSTPRFPRTNDVVKELPKTKSSKDVVCRT